jgi:hypothetical protein
MSMPDLKMILRFLHSHTRCELNIFLPHNYFEKWYVLLPKNLLVIYLAPFGKKFPVFKIHRKIGLQKFLTAGR